MSTIIPTSTETLTTAVTTNSPTINTETPEITTVLSPTTKIQTPDMSTIIPTTTAETLTTAVTTNSPSTIDTETPEVTSVLSPTTKIQTDISTIIPSTAETLTTALTTNSPSTINTETPEITTVLSPTTNIPTPDMSTIIPSSTAETLTTALTTNSPSTIKTETPEITSVSSPKTNILTPDMSTIMPFTSVTMSSPSTTKTETPENTSVLTSTMNIQTPDSSTIILTTTIETLTTAVTTNSPSTIKTQTPEVQNASSELLGSLESLSIRLNDSFEINTPLITLVRTTFTSSFAKDLNSTVSIEIPFSDNLSANITTILLSTFNNVIPPRNSTSNSSFLNDTSNPVDGSPGTNSVFLVNTDKTVNNVTLKFKKINESLPLDRSFQCVFWNFELVDETGAWDDEGCTFVSRVNGTVTCNCTHLTSFSILMATSIPEDIRDILDIITYIGVGISLASLVISVTTNTTALMRHISIVNTALSLLIADICFIIAASYSQKALESKDGDHKGLIGQCTAVTFFMHFFYLALFFWMLVSGLLIFYRTVMVFSHMSKSIMIAIGFVVGYGCPLIIAVTTVAATAPSQTYIRKNYTCWLNWTESKALLSLVIPALVIVVINIIVVIVVLCKMMRRSSGNTIQPDEKNSFVVIIRCLAILTPLFGLTWALGIGTMVSPKDKGIHIAFAFFNSLQMWAESFLCWADFTVTTGIY
uniref:Adhesion G protein-coupled receptor F7 n=1 Tax=Oryzias melastigma TaxID=30732 RepID=A0A3B3C166_ORYME